MTYNEFVFFYDSDMQVRAFAFFGVKTFLHPNDLCHHYRDDTTDETFDAIQYTTNRYSLSDEEAIEFLFNLLGETPLEPFKTNKGGMLIVKKATPKIYELRINPDTNFTFYHRFPDKYIDYFRSYGITGQAASDLGIYAVHSYTTRKTDLSKLYTIKDTNTLIIGFEISKNQYYKIYKPFEKDFRFLHIGDKNPSALFGLQLLKKRLRFKYGIPFILTGGNKDVATFVSARFDATCLNSETARFNDEIITQLNLITDDPSKVILMYDRDQTGEKNAHELSEKYGFTNLSFLIPDDLLLANGKRVKDISDLSKYYRERNEVKELESFYANLRLQIDSICKAVDEPIKLLRSSKLNSVNTTESLSILSVSGSKAAMVEGASSQGVPGIIEGIALAEGKASEIPLRVKPPVTDRVRTANQRLKDAATQADMHPLMGDLIKVGMLIILFADTGIGKTLFGYDLADALSRGQRNIFGFKSIGKPCKVLYYDLELLDKPFEERYKGYEFDDNLLIATSFINNRANLFDKSLIIADILRYGPDIIFVDNITCLSSNINTDPEIAKSITDGLNDIRREYGITIIVMAHTPKIPSNRPLHINHLGGSKFLSNFVDSVIGLAKSARGKDFRYIKSLKGRNSVESDKVFVYEILKIDGFIRFKYKGEDYERNHIGKLKDDSRGMAPVTNDPRITEARKLKNEGLSYSQIGRKFNVSKSTVGNWLSNENDGSNPVNSNPA